MWYSFSRDIEEGILRIVVSSSSLEEIKIIYGCNKTRVNLTKNFLSVNVECFFKKVEIHTDDDKQDVNVSVEYENNSDCDFSIAITPNKCEESDHAKVCEESSSAEMCEESASAIGCEEPTVAKMSESEEKSHTPSMAAMLQSNIRTDIPPERLLHHPKIVPKIGPKTDPVDHIFLTYDQIVNLICEAIKNANELMEKDRTCWNVNILDIITTKLNGHVLKFNPSNLTNFDTTIMYWKKFSMNPPILDTKINKLMFENTNILVVLNQYDKTKIRSVLYGYGLKEKENSSLIFE